jgi:hypothetical protein
MSVRKRKLRVSLHYCGGHPITISQLSICTEPQQDQQPARQALIINNIPPSEVEPCELQSVQQLILQHRIWIEPEIFAGAL